MKTHNEDLVEQINFARDAAEAALNKLDDIGALTLDPYDSREESTAKFINDLDIMLNQLYSDVCQCYTTLRTLTKQ